MAVRGGNMSGLATNLVRNCLRIRPDDNVTIFFYPHSTHLAEDIAVECFRVGADVNLSAYTDRFYESYMKLLPAENLRRPSVFCKALTEVSTAEFWVSGVYDASIFRRIPPEKMAAASEGETAAHYQTSRERKVRSVFVALSQVTRPRAKTYGFSYPAWEKMVREATAFSGAKLAQDGKRLAAALQGADHVRIAGNGTDLEFSIQGRKPFVFDGVVDDDDIASGALDETVPAGSVAIAAVETSADGVVATTVPQPYAGRMIRKLQWEFRDGKITSFEGDAGAKALRKEWEASTGDKDRIASVTIGLNPKAKTGFLQNWIVRGAVTLAVGGNEDLGGKSKVGFGAGMTLGDVTLEADGKAIVKAGRLVV